MTKRVEPNPGRNLYTVAVPLYITVTQMGMIKVYTLGAVYFPSIRSNHVQKPNGLLF